MVPQETSTGAVRLALAVARKAGMTDAMFGELQAVVAMANETNRLANGYQVEIDERVAKAAKQR